MTATNFKAENNTFRKLIGNGLTYRIPRFQRDYSWTNDHWEELWADVQAMLGTDGEPSHYMGYLVLQSADDRSFDVIDGQQRLTTLSLIVLAVLKNIQRLIDSGNEPEANRQRLNQIRQADLFKTIRAKVTDREGVFQLLRGMDEDLDSYLALSSPEVSEWSLDDKRYAGVLRTFRVRQPFALLLAARRAFDAVDFTDLLRAAVVISLRYNVIGAYSTGEQERTYNTVAERIAKGELSQLRPALQAMRNVYVTDKAFRAAFAEKSIRTTDSRNNRVVRFILCAVEQHLSGQDHAFVSDAFNIEHVLPQNAPDGWEGFSNDEAGNLVYRLGNMTLMASGANRDAGTEGFLAKRALYEHSGFAITRKLAQDNTAWTPERIATWQNWMADQATSVWRIDQLS